MFDTVREKSHKYLDQQLDELQKYCTNDLGVAEMVKYIVAYSDQMAYCGGNEDAKIGREIIQFLWQINGMDLSDMGNSIHFDPSWARKLNSFIGNFIFDDSGFDFEQAEFNGAFEFKSADDNGRWLQNPWVLVEAAKANREYYERADKDVFSRLRERVDGKKVLELVK